MSSEGLTPQEIEAVKNSWDIVRKDGKQFGNQLFINFFTKYPAYQQLFKSLANIPLNELHSSKRLLAHTTNVMYALTAVVDNLEDTEMVTEMLYKMGVNHKKRKLNVGLFNELGSVLFDLLTNVLGSEAMDSQLTSAWTKTYSVIVAKISAGFA
ncbi:cytoglobin-2-like [Oppia nitens]|uniref:cytoglobin-2-like n=1 Tax=Oppia nitens TaxID=1686743 RepID=UPI0023DC49AF|nr:cytoglobin-2-like [Oppia nitens]